jgi:hypothetical protein
MKPYTRKEYESERDARIKAASMGHHLSELLRINMYNRIVRKLRELHKKKEAEQEAERLTREALGLPPPPPPPPVVAKPTKGERSRTKKPEAPPPKPSRVSSNPDPKTEYAKAQDQKYMRGQAWRAHDIIKGLKTEALAKASKAQTTATQLAAAVVDERKSLATTYTDEGEASLSAKSEAAYRAEARAQSLNAVASKFDGVEERMRAKLATIGRAAMEEAHLKQTIIDNKLNISKWGGQIFSIGRDHAKLARSAELTKLADKWSRIATIARSLEASVNLTNPEDIKAIANHLGNAIILIEQTSPDNEDKANEIKKLISQAQTIEIKATASTRNKAGFKRTKKHRKKRRKTRNNITNKFVAQKH